MTTLGQLFRILGERLTTSDLTTVWHRTTNQTGAAVDNILTLLADVASTRFVQTQLEHLFYLVESVSATVVPYLRMMALISVLIVYSLTYNNAVDVVLLNDDPRKLKVI